MGQENVDDIKLMLEDEPAARAKAKLDLERMLSISPEKMASAFPTLLSAADRAASTPEFRLYMAGAMHAGLAAGDEGWWDDSWAHLQPWGFQLASIRVPVQLWHGRQDQFVPFQHGQWLASQIPGVDPHLTEEDGHTTLLQNRVGEVHGWLLDQF